MQMQLIQGTFSRKEALDLLTQLVHVKIKFHEQKIEKSDNEVDIQLRESQIKAIQKEFYDVKQFLMQSDGPRQLEAVIHIC